MATYNPLRDYLKAQGGAEVTLPFSDVTKLIEPNLIETASGRWQQSPDLAKVNEELRSVGYVGNVDPDAKTITFRRINSPID